MKGRMKKFVNMNKNECPKKKKRRRRNRREREEMKKRRKKRYEGRRRGRRGSVGGKCEGERIK